MAIIGTNATEILQGTALDDQIFGLDGNDNLYGNAGNDLIEGGNGYDYSVGGAGKDTFVITDESATSSNGIADFELGVDRIDLSKLRIAEFATVQRLLVEATSGNGGFVFYRNGQNITTIVTGILKDNFIAGDFIFALANTNDTETGGSQADFLFAGLGNDKLSGGNGDDRLFGETGDDRLWGGSPDLANAASDGNDYLYGGGGNDQLFGGGQSDWLYGDDGDDRLDGGGGNDNLIGGNGLDVFVLRQDAAFQSDNINDFDLLQDKLDVTAFGIGEFDTIKALSSQSSSGDLVIVSNFANVQNQLFILGVLPGSLTANNILLSTSSSNNALVGSGSNDDLFAGLGNDTLSGGVGNDRLFGEQGDDLLYGNDKTDPVGNSADGNDLLYGGGGNDQLFGGGGKDTLNGGSGDDTLEGGSGGDALNGGLGFDSVSYAGSTAAVTVRLWENSSAGGDAAGDFFNGIEGVIGSNFDDNLIGNAKANVLNGKGGGDVMNGQEGNDTYFVDSVADKINDRSGNDTVNSLISYTLGGTLENLVLSGGFSAIGNVLNNTITGNAGNNTLNGLDGIDTVSYASAKGGVNVNLGISNAQNTGGAGTDTVLNFENLVGSDFNDILTGNGFNNTLTGGAGADQMTGGGGADSFVINSKTGTDNYPDFVAGTDKLFISQGGLRIGDGDGLIEGGVIVAQGPGGFGNKVELVIMQKNIAGAINAASAAAIIGSANSAYSQGNTVLFAVDNGGATGLFLFTAANADAVVSAGELSLLGLAASTAATALADYGFVG